MRDEAMIILRIMKLILSIDQAHRLFYTEALTQLYTTPERQRRHTVADHEHKHTHAHVRSHIHTHPFVLNHRQPQAVK